MNECKGRRLVACTKAKNALKQFLKEFTCIEIENRPDCNEIQDALAEITRGRSVPRVFIGGKFIGGGDDTAAKAASGELKTLLSAQGL
ncbi:thioredoxin-like protein [Dunaliella salina]|uniref:Thioredoxin-like protein n=1 Tax=Dunaliella salina TaxID=3046 RepID=A0ABQ7GBP2_DUNSA|nr:thioredoxin-like protein [Dunaliella salina]|eukprot:KAF5832036.1 thioredoxin-like protein [Dunaliella salina]